MPRRSDLRQLRPRLRHARPKGCKNAAGRPSLGPAIARGQLRRRQGFVVLLDVDPTNALTKKQALDPVDVGRPLADQPVPFTVRAAKILFLNTRDHHHGTDMALAAVPGDQRVKQALDIDAVGLQAYEFWEFNLRFKTDGSENGPVAGHPVIIPASMRGDRAFVIFAAPTEISPFIKSECPQ